MVTNIMEMIMIKCFISFSLLIFVSGCTIVPGMQEPNGDFFGGENVYFEEKDIFIPLINVDDDVIGSMDNDFSYSVSPGDVLTFVIWGLEEVFPMRGLGAPQGTSNPQTSRTVNTDGTIFFPYAGLIQVSDLTIEEVRNLITRELSEEFVNPQLDITVTDFNDSRKAYLLGEVIVPQSFVVGIEKISLTDAIGSSRGLDPRFSNARKVYLVRKENNEPAIYVIDLSSPEKFLLANDLFLKPNDIIYVASSAVTKWNRFFSQIFPFASFFNQIDNIGND